MGFRAASNSRSVVIYAPQWGTTVCLTTQRTCSWWLVGVLAPQYSSASVLHWSSAPSLHSKMAIKNGIKADTGPQSSHTRAQVENSSTANRRGWRTLGIPCHQGPGGTITAREKTEQSCSALKETWLLLHPLPPAN